MTSSPQQHFDTVKAADRVKRAVRHAHWVAGNPDKAKLASRRPRPRATGGTTRSPVRIDGLHVRESPGLIQRLPDSQFSAIQRRRWAKGSLGARLTDGLPVARYFAADLQRVLDRATDTIDLRNLVVVRDSKRPVQPTVISGVSLDRIRIEDCQFENGLTLTGVRADHVTLRDIRIGEDRTDRGTLRLRDCVVGDRLVLTTRRDSARDIDLITVRGCQLTAGARMIVACKRLDLTGTVFGAPSAVSVATHDMAGKLPMLRSLASASVANVRFEGFDLEHGTLRGAQGLESAQFARCRWPRSPGLARRRFIYDELLWRRNWPTYSWASEPLPRLSGDRSKGQSSLPGIPPRRWSSLGSIPADGEGDTSRRLTANEIEEVYRALARGASANGDHAAAAEYVWGQMTMRRLAGRERLKVHKYRRSPGGGDRSLVRVYRAVGGLGVRARWPLSFLGLLVVSVAIVLSTVGFGDGSVPCSRAACTSSAAPARENAEAIGRATSLTVAYMLTASRVPSQQVAYWVPSLVGVARLLSLILLGLATVALRSRVRRST